MSGERRQMMSGFNAVIGGTTVRISDDEAHAIYEAVRDRLMMTDTGRRGGRMNGMRLVNIEPYEDCRIVLHDEDEGFPVSELKTVDAVPVVHGLWECVDEQSNVWSCSVCKEDWLMRSQKWRLAETFLWLVVGLDYDVRT